MIGHSLFGAAAALSLVALLVVAPASAMDKQVTQGGPDLTKARALIKAKDFAAAIKELKRLEVQGLNADVLNLLAFSQRKSGDFETSYKNYQRALKINPDHKSAREYLGELFVQTGRMDEARAQLKILERLCPAGCEEREDLEEAIAAATR
jgi:tetratricopeptide (TPR) repeat protein